MQELILYHNPHCSKSRKTLELLQEIGLEPTVIEYLKTPLNKNQLSSLRTHFKLEDFVRTNEPIFKEMGLSLADEEQILHAMLKAPILMQRPIATFKGKAIIGRPPEQIFDLFL